MDMLTQIFKLFVAIILGGIMGLEREKMHMPAGLRTMMLVALGSTLTTTVSIDFFNADPARIAAGILTGIGFLGAGTIISSAKSVHGITTAATIWVTAAVGIAIGVGYYLIATLTSFLVFIILILGKFEKQ